jgi:hypothetical protein
MIGGREPAFWIGLIVTLIIGVLTTLTGEGVISDALAGRITEFTNAIAELAVLLAPLIAGLWIRQNVTPVAAPVLPVGTAVTTPTGGEATVKP